MAFDGVGGFVEVCGIYCYDGPPCGLELVKEEIVPVRTQLANRGVCGRAPSLICTT